jgi:hypothetical protein
VEVLVLEVEVPVAAGDEEEERQQRHIAVDYYSSGRALSMYCVLGWRERRGGTKKRLI